MGAQLGGLSCNWIGLYLGSVVKVKRLEAFSNGLKTRETPENKKGHYQLVLWGKRVRGCVCVCVGNGGKKGRQDGPNKKR